MKTTSTIHPPQKPLSIPNSAKWLGGQGIGGWFFLEPTSNNMEYRIIRYSPEGSIECDRIFTISSENSFDIDKDFSFTYISHCAECNVLQDGMKYRFLFKN